MKRNNLMIPVIIFSTVMFLTTITSFGQEKSPDEMGSTKEHFIKSGFNNKSYQLHVSLPKSYLSTGTFHYPVLYVLDGKFSFASFHSTREVLDLGKEIREVIIVAVDNFTKTDSDWYAGRYYDYTPSSIPASDTLWSKMLGIREGKLKSGGAAYFLNTLQKEIIPFIDKQYKTTGDRGLSGHSLGGLFVGYCLFTQPALFKRYSLNSPAFWWNNYEMLSIENSFATQNTALPANVFFSAGALEGEMMIAPIKAFTSSLKSHHYQGMLMTTQIFDGETHLSVVPACNSRTLKVLYDTGSK